MQFKKILIVVVCFAALLAVGMLRTHLGIAQMKAVSDSQDARQNVDASCSVEPNLSDAIEEKLFERPISVERNGEFRIGVKCLGGIYAVLSVYCAKDGRYEKLFSCPAVIGRNGPGKQMEGDAKTPLGTWKVGKAYGIKEDPGSQIPYTQVTEDMYWCGDSTSANYNTLIYHSDNPDVDHTEDEHLISIGMRYNYILDMGYNAACSPYVGSAIFLHCWKDKDYPTSGCVAISEEDMVKVLQTVTPNTSVTIY
ncbi:MAG: L,D-transpeptidase family protein [Planctomycetia bacterium]|nr:L,D-transpeptidase family protein [Planctomycetia bacterium]